MLFKYMTSDRIDVLENLKIRFSPLVSLNDPFEALPLIDARKEREHLIFDIERGLEDLWTNTELHEKTPENRQILENTKSKLVENVNRNVSPNAIGEELMSLLGGNFGVLSLSRTEGSLLMWSHYAEEGKGFVIALDDKHSFFRQRDLMGNITRPIPVVYSGKRRKIVLGEENFYQKLLCEKPLEWAYEEEERIFRTCFSKEGATGKDEYGQEVVLSDLPVDAINSVYIGYHASENTKRRIISAIENNCIKCAVFTSSICDEEYRVLFHEIK